MIETNIELIRQAALLLLEMPIQTDKNFEFICHHPFIRDTFTPVPCPKTDENPVGMELLDVRNEENLSRVKKHFEQAIYKCKQPMDFFVIINKPYSGVFFKVIKEFLSNEDFTIMLEALWTTMEYPNSDVNVTKQEWISYWQRANLDKYIYSDEDKKKLAELPDTFLVYRGLMKDAKLQALSWTLDPVKAIWFARRFSNTGKVYKALCHKKDVLAYLSCRNEEEIVVDWKKLKNIEEVSYV